MGWIDSVHWEKILIASCSNETIQNASKHYEMHQNMSLGPTRWIRCITCEKFWCDFVARTCALITPVQPILHRVSCSNETLPNAPKHYETHRTWVYGPMGWIGCVHFEKFRCDFVARTFALIAPVQPVLYRAWCSTKQSKMHKNTTKRANTWV